MQLNKSCSKKFVSLEEKQPSNFQEEEVDIVGKKKKINVVVLVMLKYNKGKSASSLT
jgi:hypothetical protein